MKYFGILFLIVSLSPYAEVYKHTDSVSNDSYKSRQFKKKTNSQFTDHSNLAEDLKYSMWIEPNFVDTQFSVLFEKIEVNEFDENDPIHTHVIWFVPLKVKAKVKEVFKGDYAIGDILEVVVYLSHLTKRERIKLLDNEFILSFCKSKSGIYFSGTTWQLQKASQGNIIKFRDVRENGTSHQGEERCIYNDHELHPDNQN